MSRILEIVSYWPIVLGIVVIYLLKVYIDDIKALFQPITHPKVNGAGPKKAPANQSKPADEQSGTECITVKYVKNVGAVYSIQDCNNKSKDTE